MNTQANTMREFPAESGAIVPATIPASRRFYWLVRRELWENRSIYIAPLAVAALIVVGFLIGAIKARATSAEQHEFVQQPYDFAALLIMATMFLVAVFYCLDALHGERRDRSVLFWKSLPVSDLSTVLSKASIPLVVLPLLTFAITAVTQAWMLVVSSVVLGGGGTLMSHTPLFQMWVMLLYHLVAIHALWYAPIYGWLMLVSGWVRRAAFLWAVLPLLAIGVVEKIAFNTSHFAAMLVDRVGGGAEGAKFTAGSMAMDPLMLLNPGRFLISPGLWIGLGVAAVFFAAAVQLRRYRGPI